MTVKDSLTPEEVEKNWERFCKLLGPEKLGNRSEPVVSLVEHLGERLALAPASAKKTYHNCFPGGLVEHSLRVLSNAAKIAKAMKWDVPMDSMIIGCLFHDLGKVGDLEEDYYVENDSDWHRDKLGQLYKYNEKIQYMTVPDRSIWLINQFGIKLTQEEFVAIMTHDGQYDDANSAYKLKEPTLSILVHHADLIATKQEKGQLD